MAYEWRIWKNHHGRTKMVSTRSNWWTCTVSEKVAAHLNKASSIYSKFGIGPKRNEIAKIKINWRIGNDCGGLSVKNGAWRSITGRCVDELGYREVFKWSANILGDAWSE